MQVSENTINMEKDEIGQTHFAADLNNTCIELEYFGCKQTFDYMTVVNILKPQVSKFLK